MSELARCAQCPHPAHPYNACTHRSGRTAYKCGCLCPSARTAVRTVKREPMGYPTRKAASDDALAEDNPNVHAIRQLIDGSWVPVWATGAVTDKRGQRIKPEMIEWAPEPMLTVSVQVTDELRRKVALLRVCKGELADDDELRLWAANVLERELLTLEAT